MKVHAPNVEAPLCVDHCSSHVLVNKCVKFDATFLCIETAHYYLILVTDCVNRLPKQLLHNRISSVNLDLLIKEHEIRPFCDIRDQLHQMKVIIKIIFFIKIHTYFYATTANLMLKNCKSKYE